MKTCIREGSSTFIPVEIQIPAQTERSKDFFLLPDREDQLSSMFLRKITVKDSTGSGIDTVAGTDGLKVTSSEGALSFLSSDTGA